MVLWIVFAGLSAAALVAVLWPLLRGRKHTGTAGISFDAAVFKDQIDEIEAERDSGLISESEAESARNEVSRRLLATARQTKSSGRQVTGLDARSAGLALTVAFILIPVSSSVLYLLYGSPGVSDQPLAARLEMPDGGQSIQSLVAQVEARLLENPQDGRGWEVIAPVYMRQRRFSDAADAYGRAMRFLGETPVRLSDYGNALVLASDGVVSEKARNVLKRAVELDGTRMRARFWLAVAHEQDGSLSQAVDDWRRMLSMAKPDAPWKRAVEERLAELEKKAGIRPETPKKPELAEATPPGEPRGPTKEDVAAARELTASDRASMIGQMVAGLAERLVTDGGSPDEWKRLIRSYMVLDRPNDAAKALADARKAYSDKPDTLAEFSELAKALGVEDDQ